MSPTPEESQTILRIFAKSRFVAVVSVLGLFLLTAGCQNRSLAERRWAFRASNLDRTLEQISAGERSRRSRLESTLATIERVEQLHARKAAAWPGRLETMLQEEVSDWERRRPRIEAELSRQMRGQPERIETTAVWMGI